MSETFTVIYEVPGAVRPHRYPVSGDNAEIDALRFAAKYPGARIRRDGDNAYYDYRSGQWVPLSNN